LYNAGGGTPDDPLMKSIALRGTATSYAHIKDAFIVSAITGEKHELRVWFPQTNETAPIDEVNIPETAQIYFILEFKPFMPLREFIVRWTSFQYTVAYDDGHQYRKTFEQDYINEKLRREYPFIYGPHVTPKGKK
jgi:hypothetical protein